MVMPAFFNTSERIVVEFAERAAKNPVAKPNKPKMTPSSIDRSFCCKRLGLIGFPFFIFPVV